MVDSGILICSRHISKSNHSPWFREVDTKLVDGVADDAWKNEHNSIQLFMSSEIYEFVISSESQVWTQKFKIRKGNAFPTFSWISVLALHCPNMLMKRYRVGLMHFHLFVVYKSTLFKNFAFFAWSASKCQLNLQKFCFPCPVSAEMPDQKSMSSVSKCCL